MQRIELGKEKPPKEDINWLGLAQVAGFKANSKHDLVSAEAAVLIYERLAQLNPQGEHSFLMSAMMLRASMINKLGAVPEHPVLDVKQIIDWFFANLTISYEEAAEKTINWQQLEIDTIRELNYIKNRLGVISQLEDRFLNAELKTWLSLKKKLP